MRLPAPKRLAPAGHALTVSMEHRRLPAGLRLLISAQFVSALADNALLIVTMALLHARGQPAWWAPLLKFGFTLSYVVLAPFVGPLADSVPKARLMAWMNGVKMTGAGLLLAGVHPVACFAVVGLGAAAYAPAKYGLVTELVTARALVTANAWLEVSVVCAALFGTGLGGLLVSPWMHALGQHVTLQALWRGLGVDVGVWNLSLCLLLFTYALAGVLNLGIGHSGALYPASSLRPATLCREFRRDHLTLWRDPAGGLSLAVTTLFWGVGATLQFAVLRWAEEVLRLPLDQAAYLQAAVALGVIAGAGIAGARIPLSKALRVLPMGALLGLLIAALAYTDRLWVALPLLCLVGSVGGLLVVPLNALLQHRGCTLLSAGRSMAVQGCNENLSVLGMLAAYAVLTRMGLPMAPLIGGFGVLIALAMGMLWLRRHPA